MTITPLINGINYDWASISIQLFGVPITGVTKISYSRKQKKENNYGVGPYPVSRGYCNVEYEGSIEMYLDEWKMIILNSPGQDPLQISPFTISVIFGADGRTPGQDKLKGVEFLADPFSASQGETKLMVTIPLIIAQIDRV
ncbi:hypothetical protein [Mucilaginibacter paludis]|uniref:Uncharacterized protein n=1 Tax=Mucilaginibacter paludis DSM 18603 TaxID=714943 RepID=H1YAZ1_9SPHI|nr:hypothetical protein [Mucilaginibacter paludis]EHQ30024.1 hypothetical protein Mucpa_5964 [Mucilaginibacter paludis DSM 18603]